MAGNVMSEKNRSNSHERCFGIRRDRMTRQEEIRKLAADRGGDARHTLNSEDEPTWHSTASHLMQDSSIEHLPALVRDVRHVGRQGNEPSHVDRALRGRLRDSRKETARKIRAGV